MNAVNRKPEASTRAGASHCLLIHVDPLRFLVPRILVAEVTGYTAADLRPGANRDIQVMEWRGYLVPVISPAVMNPRCVGETQARGKLIVFHGLLNRARLPFYAMPVTTNPRLIMVSPAMLDEAGDEADMATGADPAMLASVRIEGEAAFIPKVDFIENVILSNIPR